MKSEHKELIHDYLNLNRKIDRIKNRIANEEIQFNSQSFSGGTVFSQLGVRYAGFRVDTQVCNYVDLTRSLERNLAMNKRRLSYFNQFLNSLDPHTVASLKRRYRHARGFEEIQELGHDDVVLDEILEIEEAISYEFNVDLQEGVQRKAIQVEYTQFSEETVEDSFQIMQELLGV